MKKSKANRRGFIKNAGMLAGGVVGSTLLASPAEAQIQEASASTSMGARFRALLARPDLLILPVIFDVATARLCELEGFDAVFLGGSWVAGSAHGVPDVGLTSITELIDYAAMIAEHTNLPLLADGDDGGGSPLNVYRATQKFERAGVAAVLYEDSAQVKHLTRPGGKLVPKNDFVDKIKAAVDARRNGLVILARNDSLTEGYSMEDALERGAAYAEAGADFIFFSGMSLQDHAKAKALVKKPLMTSITSSQATQAQARAAGVNVLYYHVDSIGLGAVHQSLKELKSTGSLATSSKWSLAPDVSSKITGSQEWIERGRRYRLI